eukprot:m.17849 g.17849  ORF g.17849 m.17849 type:complete len:52 (+) comp27561_c0_seq3:188-343(+)
MLPKERDGDSSEESHDKRTDGGRFQWISESEGHVRDLCCGGLICILRYISV